MTTFLTRAQPATPLSVADLPGVDTDVVPLPQAWTVYRWGWAPRGLATRRQLRALGLAPGGRAPVAEIRWHRDRKVAYLYDLRTARPKRTPTPGQLAALGKAMTARRTCPDCARDVGYCIPTRYRRCLDCHESNGRTAA